MTDSTYAVVGGGIVGSSIAYHLSRDSDAEVVVFERNDEVGAETTARSGATFGWYGDATQRQMKRYGWELYNDFLADPLTDPEPYYEYTGMLKVATTPETAERLERYTDLEYDGEVPKTMQGREADAIEYLEGESVKRTLFAPKLNDDAIEGAVFRPNYGYAEPVRLATEFAERARKQGARFEFGTLVTDLRRDDGRVTGVETEDGLFEADHVISAAGPWNVELARSVGIDLPVRHTLGPMIRLDPDDSGATGLPLVVHEESGSFCRRNPDGTYLLGHRPRDPDAPDRFDPDAVIDEMPPDLRERALDAIEPLLPQLADANVTEEWVAVRSDVADDRPILGWTSVPGFSVAAFDSSGIQLAPATGRIVARQLLADDPTEYYDAVSITRFEGYDDVR